MGTKVFFNNSCNICRFEIDHYKKISDDSFEWIDITNNEDALSLTSKSQKDLLRRLHVINQGKVIVGAEAFIVIWSNSLILIILWTILSQSITDYRLIDLIISRWFRAGFLMSSIGNYSCRYTKDLVRLHVSTGNVTDDVIQQYIQDHKDKPPNDDSDNFEIDE